MQIRHPAKYSNELMPILKDLLKDSNLILDPFSGTGKRIRVSDWHKEVLLSLRLNLISETHINTKRNRFGKNSNLRVDCETIFLFSK